MQFDQNRPESKKKRSNLTDELQLSTNLDDDEQVISEVTCQVALPSNVEAVRRADEDKNKATIIILGGQDQGKVIELDVGKTVFGRQLDCDIVLRDQGISRHHMEIVLDASGTAVLFDLSSTNGTFLNGERVDRVTLRDGDKVLLGQRVLFRYTYQDKFDTSVHEELFLSVTRDAMTGAYNRKYLMQRITTDLSFARRHHLPLSFILMDLDHFKQINDTFGHQAGDQALMTVADVVMQMVRNEDLFARYGGEEFAVLAPGTDISGGRVLGERIRSGVEQTTIIIENRAQQGFAVTVSVGVAAVHRHAIVTSEQLIAEADNCLYRAKQNGRNRVEVVELGCDS